MTTFDQKLAFGKIAEAQIVRWLRCARDYSVLPLYAIEVDKDSAKGPRLFTPMDELILPDMLVIKGTDVRWIEAKHKTAFSWSGKNRYWETGIDLRHFYQYCTVNDRYPWDIWLLFLHTSDRTWDRDVQRWNAPERCPTGLFGGTLRYLRERYSHKSDRHGNSGMIYWQYEVLKQMATLAEVEEASL